VGIERCPCNPIGETRIRIVPGHGIGRRQRAIAFQFKEELRKENQ
jgi:hypothetical protein